MRVRIKNYEELCIGRMVDSDGDIHGFHNNYYFEKWMREVCGMTASIVEEDDLSLNDFFLTDFICPNGQPAENIDEDIINARFTYDMVDFISDSVINGDLTATVIDGDYPGIKIEMTSDGKVHPMVYVEKYPDDGKYHVSLYEEYDNEEPSYLGIYDFKARHG